MSATPVLVRRAFLAALIALAWLVGGSALAAPAAEGATRAVLSWDTDDTDIDLHVWDGFGNHAYFGDQEALSTGVLSEDILYGFGPENYTETFYETLAEGEPLYFGVCYFRSHWAGGSVPATTVTLTVTDPDGTERRIQRVLRSEKESFLLGSSPNGSVEPPTDAFCGSGSPHVESDTGDPTPSAEISEAACADTSRRIGAVVICGQTIEGSGSRYTMRGSVRVNGAVSLGDGPVTIDTAAGRITTAGNAEVSVLRAGGPVRVASGQVTIETAGVRDGVSGRSGLAKLKILQPALASFQVGQLETTLLSGAGLSAPATGSIEGFLDTKDGGGVILSGTVKLDIAPGTPSGTLAVGIHRSPAQVARALGGSADFDEIGLPGSPWKARLALSYSSGDDTWAAKGGITTPVLGLDVDGRLVRGKLDGIGVKVSRDVPLGNTGFILSSVAGRVEGITVPPMKVTAGITGKWGAIPGVDAGVVMLDNASLSFSTDLSASIDGAVSFGIRNGPVKGETHLGGRLEPFSVAGSMKTSVDFKKVIELSAGGQAQLSRDAFSALEEASGKLLGRKVAGAKLGLSNKGLGAVSEVCIPVPFSDCKRMALGASMRWDKFGRFSFGGDALDQIGVRSGVGGRRLQAGPSTVRASGSEPFLIWQVDGQLVNGRIDGPGAAGCRAGRDTATCVISFDPATNVTTAYVFGPARGEWSLRSNAPLASPSVEKARVVPVVGRPTASKLGSRRKPLPRKGGRITVRWDAKGASTGRVRVDVYLTAAKGQAGTLLRTDRTTRGSVKLRRDQVPAGGQYVRLVIKVDGLPAGEVYSKKAIWVG